MATLRPDPGLYDVEAWRQRLAELHADLDRDPDDQVLPVKIAYARVHLAAIGAPPQETPVKAV